MKKKLLAILTSVLLLMTAIPLGAVSVSAATSGDYTYTVTDGEATITDYPTSSSYGGAITIPATLGGYPVTTIGYDAFFNCTKLTSVTIPDSVTTIGGGAFENCTSLTSVTIGNSVITIGVHAFEGCDSLTSVTIPDSVTYIGKWAFEYCDNLTTVTIGDSVTAIGDYAFWDCDSLTSVTIGDSVITIGAHALDFCDSLTSVIIPNSVTTIGDYAFQRCTRLTDVYYTGSEADRAAISIGSSNTYLTNATWHYADDPISDEVTHSVMDTKNGTGLAFRFELTAKGVVRDNRNVVGLTNATVNYLGKDCQLIGMGTVVTNDATIGEGNLTLDAVNDYDVVDIPTVYLMEAEADYCAFATRIINIPDSAVERTIYARPYYIVEVDGEQITVYGDMDSASCAEYL